ncbi:MAG TPA: class D sortase [Bryobacteraceae bacterium]|nr:class D sortase [Bryobacteraceae bacterium]
MRVWRPSHITEFFLLVVGLLCLGYFGQEWLAARWAQHQAERELELATRSRGATQEQGKVKQPAPGETIGRVEIPRLQISAIVKSGVDDKTLKRAVGHVPHTSLPGEAGNIGIAAHRDTYFRNLRGVKRGDLIRFVTPDGAWEYTVDQTRIVTPKDVEVLDPTPQNYLTLVTCYPFNYVGSAPKRFIVHARQTGGQEAAQARHSAGPRVASNSAESPGRTRAYAR